MLQQTLEYRLVQMAPLVLLTHHFGEVAGLVQQKHCSHQRYLELVRDPVEEAQFVAVGFRLVVLGDMG